MCSGYYNYEHGYLPDFKGRERFRGVIIHPQKWPDELDYSGKRVVIIGSGATAMTLIPAMAEKARAGGDGPAIADLCRFHCPTKTGLPIS